MRIGLVIRALWRLYDKADDRKIDLEADLAGVTAKQKAAILSAQVRTAKAMELISSAHGILADAFPSENPYPKGIHQ